MRAYDKKFDDFNMNSFGNSAADVAKYIRQSIQYVLQMEAFNFNSMGETVFYRAVMDNQPIAYLQQLLDEGADESVRCGFGQITALLNSIDYQTHDVVSFLIQTPNAPVNVGRRDGTTPLHELGDIWTRRSSRGLTKGGCCVMVYVEQLLSTGANPFIKDRAGSTPRDLFMLTAAQKRDPTKARAIVNRLKMAEDGLVEDINNQRLMAVMMATQERIGADSPLSELDPDILRMIVERSMGALLTADDIGEMQTEEIRALKRIGFTPEMRIAVKSWRDPSGALRA